MDSYLIIGAFYAVLIFTDLIPAIREKKTKGLFFSIPVYLITLIVNIMIVMGVQFPAITTVIQHAIQSMLKIP